MKRGYILTADQSDAGSAGIFSRRTSRKKARTDDGGHGEREDDEDGWVGGGYIRHGSYIRRGGYSRPEAALRVRHTW
eukprot:38419-Prorocentrum_minimum.AAC.1